MRRLNCGLGLGALTSAGWWRVGPRCRSRHLAVGETVIPLNSPFPCSRRFNRDDEGVPAK